MKRFTLICSILLFSSVFIVGFLPSDTKQAEQVKNEEKLQVDLEKGIEVVIFKVEKLYGKVRSSPEDINEINKTGKSIAKNWDIVEKQVAEKHPKDYETIEESLYPLIANSQSDSPDIDRMKSLIEEVIKKLSNFKRKVS